jgi:hypothetical protein
MIALARKQNAIGQLQVCSRVASSQITQGK